MKVRSCQVEGMVSGEFVVMVDAVVMGRVDHARGLKPFFYLSAGTKTTKMAKTPETASLQPSNKQLTHIVCVKIVIKSLSQMRKRISFLLQSTWCGLILRDMMTKMQFHACFHVAFFECQDNCVV